MNLKRPSLLAAIAGLTACGGAVTTPASPNYVWDKEGVTAEQMYMDQTTCAETMPATGFMGMADDSAVDYYVRCLKRKGYRQVFFD